MENIRCFWESYCLNGECRAWCSDQCALLRTDVNPCADGSICVTSFGEPMTGLCHFRPLVCVAAENCPQYRPPLPDGGSGEWSCTDGRCAYPGFSYPTEN